jgi:hypothetical protein
VRTDLGEANGLAEQRQQGENFSARGFDVAGFEDFGDARESLGYRTPRRCIC